MADHAVPHLRDATDTSVDHERASEVAKDLAAAVAQARVLPSAWDDPGYWNVDASRAERCQFLAVGNAMNFRFWELTAVGLRAAVGRVGDERLRGSMYLWRRLRLATTRGELATDARTLASMTAEKLRAAFADDDGLCPLETGLKDRVENLRDLGDQLLSMWNGEFVNVVDGAAGSLATFAALSSRFRAFDDPLQKLTMVNAIMLSGSGLVVFDEDPLPGIDYHLVKQALRQGIVKPKEGVATKLKRGELLDAGEALELRSATAEALLLVSNGAGVSTGLLDNAYWTNRQLCRDVDPACMTDVGLCPFEGSCEQHVEFGLPLELTRYY